MTPRVDQMIALLERQQSDPDHTLLVQLTRHELNVALFGLLLINRLFPELTEGIVEPIVEKFKELTEAQEFLA